MLAAIAPAAVVLAGEVLFDLPHPAAAIAVEHVRGGQLPVEIDRTARMHREQLADIVPVERDQIGDLLALGLGELEPLSGLDLEADVSGRGKSRRLARFENGCCTVHVRTSVLRLTAGSGASEDGTARLPQVRSNDDNIAQASLRSWRHRACPDDGRPAASQMTFANRNTRQGDHAMDSINVKARRLAPLDTPTDLRSDATKDIAAALTLLLTDFFALYLKTKNFHWHMSGPHFRDYHLLLDDQGDQILAATDAIAERVRKIGGTTLRSIGQISRSQRLLDNDADYVTPHDMLAELREDNKQLVAFMRETHDLCDEGNDVASASLIENWIDEAEQRSWFLFEASRTSGSVGDSGALPVSSRTSER